jgi:prepilin-type N-terminal cleavage/methylation domain-containing protein/prepilin-type processing-associated H-X9-DG protein
MCKSLLIRSLDKRCHSRGFTLIESLVTISIICLLTALLLPAIQAVRESSRRALCMANFAQVGLAVQNYAASTGYFPPGAIHWTSGLGATDLTPRLEVQFSLFTRILPQLEQNPLFDSINFHNSIVAPNSFGSESGLWIEHRANDTARSTRLAVLLCPSDSAQEPSLSAGTNIRSNEGTMPFFTPTDSSRFSGPAGSVYVSTRKRFSSWNSTTVASVTDGLSSTVLVSEKLRSHVNDGDGLSWDRFHPNRDFVDKQAIFGVESGDEVVRICGDTAMRTNLYFPVSGHVWMIGSLLNATYNHVALPNPPFADCLSNWNGCSSARSQHPGGVNVGMADGSVRFVRNGVTLQVWRALGSKAAGEVISIE